MNPSKIFSLGLCFCLMLFFACNKESSNMEELSEIVNTEETIQAKALPLTGCNNFNFPYSYSHLFRQGTDGDGIDGGCVPQYATVGGTDRPIDRFYDCRFDVQPLPIGENVSCTEYWTIPLYKVCASEEPTKPAWRYWFYPASSYNNFDPGYFFINHTEDSNSAVFELEHFEAITDLANARILEHLGGANYPFMEVDFMNSPPACSCMDVNGNCITQSELDGSRTCVCGTKPDVFVRVRACAYTLGGF